MQRHRREWQIEAKCADDWEMTDSEAPIKEIMEYCADCPVLQECRTYAIVHEEYGSWGGLNRRALTKLRKNLSEIEKRRLVRQAVENRWIEPHNLYPTLVAFYTPDPKPKASSLGSLSTKPREGTLTLDDLLSDLSAFSLEFSSPPLEECSPVAQ